MWLVKLYKWFYKSPHNKLKEIPLNEFSGKLYPINNVNHLNYHVVSKWNIPTNLIVSELYQYKNGFC